jgi:hypothetical protein
VEPTPGYEVLLPRRTLLQVCRTDLATAFAWCRDDIPLLGFAVGLIAAAARFRRELADRLLLVAWRACYFGPTRQRVKATLRLLERRLRLAALGRPPYATLSAWYGRLAAASPDSAGHHLARMLALGQWTLYSPCSGRAEAAPWSSREVDDICRLAVKTWTLRQLRRSGTIRRGRLTPREPGTLRDDATIPRTPREIATI